MEYLNINLLAAKEQNSLRSIRKEALQKDHDALLEKVLKHGYANIKALISTNLLTIDLEQEALDVLLHIQEDCKQFIQQWHSFEKTIFIEPAKRSEAVQAMEQLLRNTFEAGTESGIFQRSGKLIRILKEPITNQTQKQIQKIRIDELDQHALMNIFDDIAFFEIYKENPETSKRINTPEQLVRLLLAKKQWGLPLLNGVIHTPTLRADGSILDTEGYDHASGLLFIPNGFKFDKIPETPTREDALAALEEFKKIFKEFPFEDNVSLSVIISTILAGLVRPSLASVPLTGISAPTMATGKSLLTECIAMIVTGNPCSAIPQADSEVEERKRLLALLLRGERIISFDNIDRPFGNAVLCSALTQGLVEDRRLGTNETIKVSTNALFLANGNQLKFIGDISTRVLLANLDAGSERPEERTFELNLRIHIPENRTQLVNAGLTMLRAYVVAGKPAHHEKPFGRFEEWDNWIRGTVIWLGMPDPCISRRAVEVEDPIRATLKTLLVAWHKIFGPTAITVKRLIDGATVIPYGASEDEIAIKDSLKNALIELSSSPNQEKINSRVLGKKLSTLTRRISNGYCLEQAGDYQNSNLWKVVTVKEKSN